MSKIQRPPNIVLDFDPISGSHEAITTDQDEMARRAKKAIVKTKNELKKAQTEPVVQITEKTKHKSK